MKRIRWMLVLGGLATATPLAAQHASTFVGVQGGGTFGDLCCSINTDDRWGGTAGLVFGYITPWYTGIVLEGNWTQKGGGNTRVDYIEVQLTVGAVVPTAGGRLRARVYGGIGIAFPVSCTSTQVAFDCDRKNSPEWAVPFGLQFGNVSQRGRLIAIDARYSIGLSDAFSATGVQNRSWQFRALVGFPVGSYQ